jgi:hypothetical protein
MRLVVKENGLIDSVMEINRLDSKGRKNTKLLNKLLDAADTAMSEGKTASIEFVKYDLSNSFCDSVEKEIFDYQLKWCETHRY